MPKRLPPHLWLSVLSLDAPLVAVAWQALMARALDVSLEPAAHAVLALAVWVIYAADRWMDGRRIAAGEAKTPRHRFAQRHRGRLAAAIGLGAVLGAALALTHLERAVVENGLWLAGGVGVYFLLNQRAQGGWGVRLPKEVAGAVLFAAGTALVPLTRAARVPGAALALAVLFGTLCLANLIAVAAWDAEADRAHGQSSLPLSWPGVEARLPLASLLIGGLAITLALWSARDGWTWLSTALLTLAPSAAGLAWLTSRGARLAGPERAMLADVVLLTPLVPLALASLGLR